MFAARSRDFTRRWVVVVLAGLVGAGTGCIKDADFDGPSARGKADQADQMRATSDHCEPPKIMIVLDRSKTMRWELQEDGPSKWDVARDAIGATVASAGQLQFGLAVFPGEDGKGQCAVGDNFLRVEPGRDSNDQILDNIETEQPTGDNFTPIHAALEAIEKSNVVSGRNNYVLLVTDGHPYCYPPKNVDKYAYLDGLRQSTITAIERLKTNGVRTYVLGFGSQIHAHRATLHDMANAGGTCAEQGASKAGCFFEAQDPSELKLQLQEISKRIGKAEECNGIDDNCDSEGKIDEGLDTDAHRLLCAKPCKGADDAKCVCRGARRKCRDDYWHCDAEEMQEAAKRLSAETGEEFAYENPERSCDGWDNDCDGDVDEDCGKCKEGDVLRCIDESAKPTDGILCTQGKKTCALGDFGDCEDTVWITKAELCKERPDDDDEFFEGCEEKIKLEDYCGCFQDDEPQACPKKGECKGGYRECLPDGTWAEECTGAGTPVPELITQGKQFDRACNGKDDDCDGIPDNGPEPAPLCANQNGVCKGARKLCGGTQGWLDCAYEVYNKNAEDRFPRAAGYIDHDTNDESTLKDGCDGLDNDCDGVPDEGCDCEDGDSRRCGTDSGPCVAGRQYCRDGKWDDSCLDSVKAQFDEEERCDGKDEDCDGEIDDNLTRDCENECGSGVETCENGRWGKCSARQPEEEVCDDVDNDCNGETDGEDAYCENGGTCEKGKCVLDETKESSLALLTGGGYGCRLPPDQSPRSTLPALLLLLGLLAAVRRRRR